MIPASLFVWDGDGDPPEDVGLTVLWRSFTGVRQNVVSLPQLVESNADGLRARLLAWIYDLGQSRSTGRSLVERLALRPGFSYWWMTQLAEKSYGKSARLFDAIRLLMLEDLVRQSGVFKVTLATADAVLAEVIGRWCRKRGMDLELLAMPRRADRVPHTTWVYRAQLPLRAVFSFVRYLSERWSRSGTTKPPAAAARLTIVDYLFHLPPIALSGGGHESGYWTDLVGVMRAASARVNWLHHFIPHEVVPTSAAARRLVDEFNRHDAVHGQTHALWDAALSPWVVVRAVADYLRLVWRGLCLRDVRDRFTPEGSQIDFWPLFERDWRESLYGSTAIINCLYLNLFETSLARTPHQDLGVFLLENQAWEMAFMHAWKTAGHGTLIGVPHSTVRFWDLRYFLDVRSYDADGGPPLPDKVAVNGPAASLAYRQGGFPMARVIDVEALRYQYLDDLAASAGVPVREPSEGPTVLVLGDYLPEVTARQMQWLVDAAGDVPGMRCVVKPHPNCPVKPETYPSLAITVRDSPLAELLPGCDIAYAGNITSAVVDAHVLGVPVVSMLDGSMFNLSPLRGIDGVVHVRSPAELSTALARSATRGDRAQQPFFYLDPSLPRWRNLLGLPGPDRRAAASYGAE